MSFRLPDWKPIRSELPWLPLPPFVLEQIDLSRLRDGLWNAGLQIAEVDAVEVDSERTLLADIGSALSFPDYFRPNWDAFDDCLGDLMREGASPTALVIGSTESLLAASPRQFARCVHLLTSASESVAREAGMFRLEVFVLGRWGGLPKRSESHDL